MRQRHRRGIDVALMAASATVTPQQLALGDEVREADRIIPSRSASLAREQLLWLFGL